MSEVIPFDNRFASFSEEVTLVDTPYILRFDYNVRGGFWVMGIQDVNQTDLVKPIKLVLNYPLTAQYPTQGLPDGEFFCIDTTNEIEKIDRNNMGEAVKLIFIPEGS